MITIYILYFFVAFVSFVYFYNKEKITPVLIFIFAQALFFYGYTKILNPSDDYDVMIATIYLVGLIFFICGSYVGTYLFPINVKKAIFTNEPIIGKQKTLLLLTIFFSVFLFLFFCYKTRFSTLSIMFNNLFSPSRYDITDARISSYSVPGTAIIYAFRISLLPVVTIAFIKKENKLSLFSKIALTVFMVFFTLITGQRAGFVYVVIMWALSYLIILISRKGRKETKIAKKHIIFIGILFVVAFFFMSVINGRVTDSLFGELVQRFLNDNQSSGYHAFHYIFEQGTCWGRNFYEEFVNLIVPGEKYRPLSSIIFSIIYVSDRGTAPPCLWGSVFYNFSWYGIIIFGFLYGLFCQYIGFRFYSKKINSLRLAIYSYMFIDLGMLLAGGPLQLFNNGFVPLAFFGMLLGIDKYVKNEMKGEYDEKFSFHNC